MANFSKSNMLGSGTSRRSAYCPRCQKLNYSTDKYLAPTGFKYAMRFHCVRCGDYYEEWIQDCKDA